VHVRFSWKAGAHVDANCLLSESTKSFMTEYAEEPVGYSFSEKVEIASYGEEPVGYSFSEKVEIASAEEGEIQTRDNGAKHQIGLLCAVEVHVNNA